MATAFTAIVSSTGARMSTVLPGSYLFDGEPLLSPWDAGEMSWPEIVAVASLAPGESTIVGGGAGCDFTITRQPEGGR